MENLDVSNKLKGYNYYTICLSIKNYLDMLNSQDIESLYLAVGLIYEDQRLLDWIQIKLGRQEFEYFKYLLQIILDNNQPGTLRYLYTVRVTKILVNLNKSTISFLYGSKK